MLRRTCAVVSIAFALSLFAATGTAATAQRTFVASNGNDANPCSIAAPCRGFARAIMQTSAGGEVIVLDSAGYGVVTITKSVALIAPRGIYAGVSVFSGDGITVNGVGIDVHLQGLSISAQGGTNGVNFTQGGNLHVEGCTISGFTVAGIVVNAVGTITVVDTSLLHNEIGVWVKAAATVTVARATIDRNHSSGLFVTGAGKASLVQSTVTNSTGSGVDVRGDPSGDTRLVVDSSLLADNGSRGLLVYDNNANTVVRADIVRSTVARNGEGIGVLGTMGTARLSATQNVISDNAAIGLSSGGAGAKARLTQNTVVHNSTGLQGDVTPSLYSPGNNYVHDNTFSDAFNVTADTLM